MNETVFDIYRKFRTTESDNNEFLNDNINQQCMFYLDAEWKKDFSCVDGLSIVHFNARSLKTNFESIKDYLKSFDKAFSVVAVSETWFNSFEESKEYMLDNYNMFSTIRTNKKGGGVTIYVHESLKVIHLEEKSNKMPDVLESVTIEIEIKNGKNIIVSCVYRVPGSNILSYSEYIEDILYYSKNKSIYVVGDSNINLLNQGNHASTKDFLHMLYSYGVLPQITKPTRITAYSTTLIDNIFTNVTSTNVKCGVLCNDISDHLPIVYVTEYKGVTKVEKNVYKMVRKCNETNITMFKNELKKQTWDNVLNETDVNIAYDNFISTVTRLYSTSCPKVRIKLNSKYKYKPWFTKGLKNACKKKNNLYKLFIKTKSKVHELKYKRYKNKLTSILRHCEKSYYGTILEQNRNDIKATWSVLNSVIKNQSVSRSMPNEFENANGHIIKGKANIAHGFNDFFTNVGPNLAQHIKSEKENVYTYLKGYNENCMFINPCDTQEVLRVVNSCSNKTSNDSDELSMKLIKQIISDVINPLTYICNQSFINCTFPEKNESC